MRLPRRSFYPLILALVAFNLLLRYPLGSQHEYGADTSYIHSLAQSLSVNGYALWILHPLSYFGLYALSYPSAGPFLSSAFNQVSGVPLEGTFFVQSLVFGTLGPLGMIVFGRSLSSDNRFALALALMMSLAPFYIKDTMWVGSTRGFVIALTPFALFLSVRFLRRVDYKVLVLLLVVCLVMSLFHRMGVLSILLVIAALFVVPFHRLTMKLRFYLYRYEAGFRVMSLGLALCGFLGVFFLQFRFPGIAGVDVRQAYRSGTFFTGDSFGVLLANMATGFVGKVGILVPLIAVGIPLYIWKRPKESPDKFVLLCLLIFLPMLPMRDYLTEFVIPLVAIFMTYALLALGARWPKQRRKAMNVALAVVLVAGGIGFTAVMKGYWSDRYPTDAGIPDSTYTLAVYTKGQVQGTLIANEGLMGGHVTAISGRPSLPLGGSSLHWFSAQQLIFRYVDGTRVTVQALGIFQITLNTDEIYVPTDVSNAEVDWETILYGHPGDPQVTDLLTRYDVHYVLVDNTNPPATFLSYATYRDSPFLSDVASTRYLIYAQPDASLYFVG